MGYTHYWTPGRTLTETEWAQVCKDFQHLFNEAQSYGGGYVALSSLGDYGKLPTIGAEAITFNGVDLGEHGDQSHEPFEITRARGEWAFCKTANKPYDKVVVAALIYLATVTESHVPTSDGEHGDWSDGLRLAYRVWPKHRDKLRIPLAAPVDDDLSDTLHGEDV